MPGDDAIVFGDLIGKLGVLRIVCPKCERVGRYRVADLIARYGHDEKIVAWTDEIVANCARRRTRSDRDPCGAICPDLPKIVRNWPTRHR